MIFTVYIYVYDINFKEKSLVYKVVNLLFILLFIAIFIFSFFPYFVEKAWLNSKYIPKTIFLNLSVLLLAIVYILRKKNKLIIMVLLILVVRIGYDWFVIPGRRRHDPGYDKQAISIGKKYKDKPIYLYKKSKVDYTASYYIARQRGKITTREFENFEPENYYFFDTSRYVLDTQEFKIIDEFVVREFDRTLYVVKPHSLLK
jgi:hypothetical protein